MVMGFNSGSCLLVQSYGASPTGMMPSKNCSQLAPNRLIIKQEGVDTLHEAALYNGLYAEYGRDNIQSIIATAFKLEVA